MCYFTLSYLLLRYIIFTSIQEPRLMRQFRVLVTFAKLEYSRHWRSRLPVYIDLLWFVMCYYNSSSVTCQPNERNHIFDTMFPSASLSLKFCCQYPFFCAFSSHYHGYMTNTLRCFFFSWCLEVIYRHMLYQVFLNLIFCQFKISSQVFFSRTTLNSAVHLYIQFQFQFIVIFHISTFTTLQ